jgi:hypothetical protein
MRQLRPCCLMQLDVDISPAACSKIVLPAPGGEACLGRDLPPRIGSARSYSAPGLANIVGDNRRLQRLMPGRAPTGERSSSYSRKASRSPRSRARPAARLFRMKPARPITSAVTGPKAARVRSGHASANVRPEICVAYDQEAHVMIDERAQQIDKVQMHRGTHRGGATAFR